MRYERCFYRSPVEKDIFMIRKNLGVGVETQDLASVYDHKLLLTI